MIFKFCQQFFMNYLYFYLIYHPFYMHIYNFLYYISTSFCQSVLVSPFPFMSSTSFHIFSPEIVKFILQNPPVYIMLMIVN